MRKTTFGVVIGNRGFFPDALAKQGRKDILDVLKKNGFNSVALSMQQTKYGRLRLSRMPRNVPHFFQKRPAGLTA